MPLIPPRKVWVSTGAAKSSNRNKPQIVRAITHPPLKKEMRAVSGSTRAGSGSWLGMLFLKGLECPTQYFDWADSRSDGGMRTAPPYAGANSPGNKRVSRLFPVITDGAKRRCLLGS
jgi:hypothetical protein